MQQGLRAGGIPEPHSSREAAVLLAPRQHEWSLPPSLSLSYWVPMKEDPGPVTDRPPR